MSLLDRLGAHTVKRYRRVESSVLHKVSPKQKDTALQILRWVVCATRPLKWRELQATFFIHPERSVAQPEEDSLRASCKRFCSSFVDLHFAKKRGPTEATVVLVHSTARELVPCPYGFRMGANHHKLPCQRQNHRPWLRA